MRELRRQIACIILPFVSRVSSSLRGYQSVGKTVDCSASDSYGAFAQRRRYDKVARCQIPHTCPKFYGPLTTAGSVLTNCQELLRTSSTSSIDPDLPAIRDPYIDTNRFFMPKSGTGRCCCGITFGGRWPKSGLIFPQKKVLRGALREGKFSSFSIEVTVLWAVRNV
jgi:hypothetical protein